MFSARRNLFFICLLVFAVLIVYSNTFNNPFVFDDGIYIEHDPLIRSFHYFFAPSEVKDLPFTPDFTTSVGQAFKTRFIGFLTFALNYKINGLDVTGYHLFNILTHLINCVLVYLLLMFTFRAPYFKEALKFDKPFGPVTYGQAIALLSSLLFAVHPVQTQAVTYLCQRFASLAALFFLAAMVFYAGSRIAERKKKGIFLYTLALLSALLAMFTKEISFTLPVVMALYEFMFFGGNYKKSSFRLAPFFLVAMVIPLNLAHGGLNASMDMLATSEGMSRWDYFFTQFRVVVTYIRLLLLPIGQNLDYDYPVYRSFFQLPVLLSFLFLSGLFFLALYILNRSRHAGENRFELRLIAFGIFWFFITLSIESSIIPIKDYIFEHRLYLPSAGFLLSLTVVLISGLGRLKHSKAIPLLVPLVLVLVLGTLAYARNGVWASKVSLWADVVRKSPNKCRPHNNLALAFFEEGQYREALKEGLMTVELWPDNPSVHSNLGDIYDKLKMPDQALDQYRIAMELRPSEIQIYWRIGNIYKGLGRIDDAVSNYNKYISSNPQDWEGHYRLADVLFDSGRLDEAVMEYQTSIRLNPSSDEVHDDLGIIYAMQGRYVDAAEEFKTALALNPNNAGARENLFKLENISTRNSK